MREHSVNSSDNFIMGWYMDDTTLCDKIISFFDDNRDKAKEGCVGGLSPEDIENGNTIAHTYVDKDVKDSLDYALNFNKTLLEEYNEHLLECLGNYYEKYTFANIYNVDLLEATNIQYYPPNGGYKMYHSECISDDYPAAVRHITFMTYLNDVTDQGETEFYYQKLKVKPEKGLTLMWSGNWMHTHRGIPSPTQEKYIATGWLHFSSDNSARNVLHSHGIKLW